MSRLAKAIDGLTHAITRPDGQPNTPIPKGWLTIQDMQRHYSHRWRHTTSSRAGSMYDRGILGRKLITKRGETMHCRAYIYRILPPAKTLDDADLLFAECGAVKVPKGWGTAKQLATILGVSVQAILQMSDRHKMPTRFFRVRRGLSGVVATRHFQIGPMLRRHQKQ